MSYSEFIFLGKNVNFCIPNLRLHTTPLGGNVTRREVHLHVCTRGAYTAHRAKYASQHDVLPTVRDKIPEYFKTFLRLNISNIRYQ